MNDFLEGYNLTEKVPNTTFSRLYVETVPVVTESEVSYVIVRFQNLGKKTYLHESGYWTIHIEDAQKFSIRGKAMNKLMMLEI